MSVDVQAAIRRDPRLRESTVEELEEAIYKGMRHGKNDHHRMCSSRGGGKCDCYYRRSVESHEALDELIRRSRRDV